jgi:hypothetical protein
MNVRFEGNNGHDADVTRRLLTTQSGHGCEHRPMLCVGVQECLRNCATSWQLGPVSLHRRRLKSFRCLLDKGPTWKAWTTGVYAMN